MLNKETIIDIINPKSDKADEINAKSCAAD